MIYIKFNHFIYEKFFKKENFGETVVMVVDKPVMDEFCTKFQTSMEVLKEEVRQKFALSWKSVLIEGDGIPKLFGLVAIQIFEAFLMQKDEKFSAREYNPRLEKYLNISSHQLQTLYTYYQDDLWQKLESWVFDNGFILHIPKIRKGSGRYRQYPLSQALLNQEDLKRVPLLFQNAGVKPGEYLVEENFVALIKNSDKNIPLSKHYYSVKERLCEQNNEQLLYLQLFSFFNNKWDGSYPKETERKKQKRDHVEKQLTILTVCNKLETIKILNQEYQIIYDCLIDSPQLFKTLKKHYNFYHKDFLIFIRDESYDEWVDRRFLELNGECLIVCETNSKLEQIINHLDSNYIKISAKYLSIFKVRLGHKISKHPYWEQILSRKLKVYVFENGLKLSRKTWMLGAGPTIRFFSETDAWIDGKKITFDSNEFYFSCRDFEIGTYRLKVKDFPPEIFHIKMPQVSPNIGFCGWQINKKESLWQTNYDNFQIVGLLTMFPTKTETASVLNWASAILKQTIKNKNSSIVINAIKRSQNGI